MNFEIIPAIRSLDAEIAVVEREVKKLNDQSGLTVRSSSSGSGSAGNHFPRITKWSDSGWAQHRSSGRGKHVYGRGGGGVGHALSVHAYYYSNGELDINQLVHFIIGSAIKDNADDRRRLRHYFDTEVASRSGEAWQQAYAQRELI